MQVLGMGEHNADESQTGTLALRGGADDSVGSDDQGSGQDSQVPHEIELEGSIEVYHQLHGSCAPCTKYFEQTASWAWYLADQSSIVPNWLHVFSANV